MTETTARKERPRVGLFATCLVDLFRPTVGFAAVRLLQQADCDVEVPPSQTCCGQPAYNSGNRQDTIKIARDVVAAFEGFDYVVAPSGSCAGMVSHHYPKLLADDPAWADRARNLARRTYELMAFLVDVRGMRTVEGVSFDGPRDGRVTYHDSCSGLRELKVKAQPRQLLDSVAGLERTDLPEEEVCCGFGGTFCIKYPDISNRMVSDKTAQIVATGAGTVLAGDLGCLLNMAGKLKREGAAVEARHVAEVLAGMTDGPAIGEPAEGSVPPSWKDDTYDGLAAPSARSVVRRDAAHHKGLATPPEGAARPPAGSRPVPAGGRHRRLPMSRIARATFSARQARDAIIRIILP